MTDDIRSNQERPLAKRVILRDVSPKDLDALFEQQLDREANWMAAFTAQNPADRVAFLEHWAKIMAMPTVLIKTILLDGEVVGSVLKYVETSGPEVSYWIDKQFWDQGIATYALSAFLCQFTERPVFARAAKDNLASLRVLEKCGFRVIQESRGYANARGDEIDELLLQLD